MYKLKTMFIPLAPTTSTSSSPSPSPLTSPLDDGHHNSQVLLLCPHPQTQDQCHHQEVLLQLAGQHQMQIPLYLHKHLSLQMLSRKCVDTAAEAIATHREAKLFFMQGLVKRILREAYREPTPLPSVGMPLVQSVFTGAPPPSKSSPYFVTHPNYHNGQFYLSGDNIPMSHSPKTSAQASSANYSQMDIPPTTTTPSTITPSSTTAPSITTSSTPSTSFHSSSNAAVSRSEVQRAFTLFGPITLVESLTKTQHLLVADIKRELQSLNNQLSNIPIAEIRNEQIQAANILTERMEALERSFAELKDVIMLRTNQTFQTDQGVTGEMGSSYDSDEKESLGKHEANSQQSGF